MTLKVSTIREVNTMGYRSEVAYAIQVDRQSSQREPVPDKSGVWFLFLSEARVNPDTQMAMYICREGEYAEEKDRWWEGGLNMKERAIHIHFDDVKWYEDYPDVQSFDALIKMAKEYPQLEGAYARKGEDHDDCEVENFGSQSEGELISYFNDYHLSEDAIRYFDEDYKYEADVEASRQLTFDFYKDKENIPNNYYGENIYVN
jgi:hypothetical protein